MQVSDKPWNGDASRWPDADSYCRSSLIDANEPGQPKTKALCSLPVYEPTGELNVAGMHAASAALVGARGGIKASPADKKAAARKLVQLHRSLKLEPPASVKQMAQ